ncbi:MAG: lysophospholipid acyltransferase family protein [Tepidisphaeraceae bacterium]|jgi:1-acyl-sn-glycerol-3-phosphate acyltransferase
MERTRTWRACQGLCRIYTTVMFDLKVYHLENIPPQGGVLLATNHQSYLDPILLAVRLRRPVSFMARSSLFHNPYFGWLIRNLRAYPVRQGRADVAAIRETIRQLTAGNVLNVFPEGSRTETGELGPMEKGTALIVRKAQVPVVCVAIDGSFEAWPKGQRLPRRHPIRVIYGKPMNLHELEPDQITSAIGEELRELLNQLRKKELLPQMNTDSHR